MRIKQTNRKPKGGLQRATFPTGFKEQCKHYGSRLKVKIGKFPTQNQVPSVGEEEPPVWSDLTPSVPSSPEVSAFVDRLNEKCSVPVDTPPCSPEHPTIGETLAILKEMEAKDSAPSSPPPSISHPSPESIQGGYDRGAASAGFVPDGDRTSWRYLDSISGQDSKEYFFFTHYCDQ